MGCKWFPRFKRNADGTIARYKAHLVAKGFTRPEIDFKETFALVVRHQTIKIILTVALTNKWSMHQMDVNNAFFQGAFQVDVFMAQPLSLQDKENPDVSKLNKSIYGL